ncbi:hypothetical protein ABPG72_008658 [Tetrahymena utriculariae]
MSSFQKPKQQQPSLNNLDIAQRGGVMRQLNGVPHSDSHLNYIPESPEFSRQIFLPGGILNPLHNQALQNNALPINPFLNISPPISLSMFDLPPGSSSNLQPTAPAPPAQNQVNIFSANLDQESSNKLNINPLNFPNQNLQQMILNQLISQQQQQLLQSQQLGNGQNNGQVQIIQNSHLAQQPQQPQQQQNNQMQHNQQQGLQQQNSQIYNQLIVQLGLQNNPFLIQQLLQIINNPHDLARFQSNLQRIQQQALQAAVNLPPQIPLNNMPQVPVCLGINNNNSNAANAVATTNNLQQKLIHQQKQKEELTNMLEFLVEKMHQTDTDQIFEKKREFKFLHGDDLTIFDNIVHKYQFSKKTKEEMIKYILRKCFKFLKSNIKQQEIVGQKDIEVAFTLKYFGNEIESQQQLQIQKQFLHSENNLGANRNRDSDDSDDQLDEVKIKQEDNNPIKEIGSINNLNSTKNLPSMSTNNLDSDDIIDKVMPFKQGSKIKTMNIQFLKMIFRSELFVKDYQVYLEKFEELAQKENQKKIQKCVKNLQDFIEKGQISKVKSYKRLPWLKIWLKETYDLAKTLCAYADEDNAKESDILASQSDLKKKLKTQESSIKLQNAKNSCDDSEQQTPYSPPDFNKMPFSNNNQNGITSGSLFSASKLKVSSPQNSEGQKSEYNAILKKQQQLEDAQKKSSSQSQQQQSGEWKTPDIVRRSSPRVDEIELPASDSIKGFEVPKAKKSSELTQNDLHVIIEQNSEKNSTSNQIIKHEENEQLITATILKNVQTLNSTLV